jgi:citrate synthase
MDMTSRGLEGVVVAESKICRIYGDEGRLIYRGYEIDDLSRNATFEEVMYLLWHGELPDGAELDELRTRLAHERPIAGELIDVLRRLPPDTPPMAALRTSASALSAFDRESEAVAWAQQVSEHYEHRRWIYVTRNRLGRRRELVLVLPREDEERATRWWHDHMAVGIGSWGYGVRPPLA